MGKVYLLIALVIASLTFILGQTKVSAVTENLNVTGILKTHSDTDAAKEKSDKKVEKHDQKSDSVNPVLHSLPALSTQVIIAKSLGSFSTGNTDVDSYIVEACMRYNIDPLLIYAQMRQESGFKQQAVSHKGASGFMQLMPDTARRFGVRNIFDPKQNVDAGVKYMRWLLDKFGGDVKLALAGYNAGEGAVMKYGNQIPPYRETQNYVAKITAHYAQIKKPVSTTETLATAF